VPIGTSLPNMTMYVLDAGMRPCPVGVVGELYVGGTGVARGYASRPDLTADRFLPDPFGEPGARLYRTGDLVRRLPDGNVDFLGRIDDQVKVRGYRIELGEIRAVLEAHPSVGGAVLTVHNERIVAYHTGAADDLAEHCARSLPEYMVPSQFVVLDAIPLNANGKVDRKALPDPDAAAREDDEFVAPRNAVEERIAAIWFELLGVEAGVQHNFFRLGGHSILAVRLISSLQEEFDLDLPIRLVFERPTIAGLAEAVETRIRAEVAALPESDLADLSMLSKELPA
jgi:acyl carrier protein